MHSFVFSLLGFLCWVMILKQSTHQTSSPASALQLYVEYIHFEGCSHTDKGTNKERKCFCECTEHIYKNNIRNSQTSWKGQTINDPTFFPISSSYFYFVCLLEIVNMLMLKENTLFFFHTVAPLVTLPFLGNSRQKATKALFAIEYESNLCVKA